jgi:cell division inhibitor SepF
MSMWRKAMNYLGLGPDEDEYYDDEPIERARPRSGAGYAPEDSAVTVRPVAPGRAAPRDHSNVRELPSRDPIDTPSVVARPKQGSSVRTVAGAASSKPHAVSPRSFNDAQEVGDRYREGQPVIVNLEGVERDLSRRIIDFTSGLCYALGGRMERVANGVYLLTPASPDPVEDDRPRSRYGDDL